MAHKFERKFLLGGLNSDDEVRALPMGDYLDANNISNAVNDPNLGGTLTNVFGNVRVDTYICPYSAITNQLPAGINRTIGSEEDLIENTVVFFNYNSNGNHGIYRWYKDLVTTSAPYGEVQQIIEYDFGWQQDTRITAINLVYGSTGTLLYWADPTPHKINLTKGNICHKQKSWVSYMPLSYEGSALFFQVAVQTLLGGTITFINVTVAGGLTRDEMFTSIAAQINAGLSTYITAEACDCSMTITENQENTYLVVFSDGVLNQLLVPDNWYGFSLIDRFFDRCKWQPMNAPQAVYEQDTSFLPNYVQKKVFQFRLQYHYDDLEGSDLALGVWSQIPINNLGCDGNSNELLNYIDVDFNDDLLSLTTTLVLLREVRFIARELNTGADRSVIDLSPCDFIDYINGFFVCHFKFYNNIISSAIDPALAAKLFDNVPLEVNDEAYAKDRLVEGGILEGYNPPDCPVGDYTIDFQENDTQKLYEVTFFVRIMTRGLTDSEQAGVYPFDMFPTIANYPFWQSPNPDINYTMQRGGIFHDTTDAANIPFFGGGGFGRGAGGDFGIADNVATDWEQAIPEGGFTIYAAGTPYFNTSKQIDIGLPTDGNRALLINNITDTTRIGAYLYNGSNNDLYSVCKLLVPQGEYVFRVASHLCSQGDVLQKGFNYDLSAGTAYQQTSTNVWGCYSAGGGPYVPNSFMPAHEIRVTVTGDIADAGTFIISDQVAPFDADAEDNIWSAVGIYLYDDSDGTTANADPNSTTFNGVSVEKALVGAGFSTVFGISLPPNYNYIAPTDHNGYFFMILPAGATNAYVGFQDSIITVSTQTTYIGSLSALFTKTLQPHTIFNPLLPITLDPDYNFKTFSGVITTTNPQARAVASTFANGRVVNSDGDAVSGVSVVYESGRVVRTNSSGNYSLLVWVDMVTINLPNFPNIPIIITGSTERIVDRLVFQLSIACIPEYPNGQSLLIEIEPISPNGSDYNPNNPFLVPDFIIDEDNNPAEKAHKRGGNYIYGIRYYDNAGRLCSVARLFDIYVPFITEDLNVSLPDQYPAGTFIYGKPVINWGINFTPPRYAAYYQFMRTENLIYDSYLQWVANQVTYLSQVETDTLPEITTDFKNGNAVAIKISLANIVTYQSQNNDSQISYSFQQGDRLRLIADSTITFYEGINDFEVTSYDATTQSILIKGDLFPLEIKSGTLFEIFNPKSVETEDEQIFYEVGEVYTCTAPNTDNNQHSTTSGTFTNGDTYWRGRLIIVNDEATKFASAYPVVIEDASVSDFYISQAQDIGRIGIIDANFRQLYNPTKMRASNMFLPSTSTNGLSSFEELNQIETDRNLGAIQRMFYINNTLINVNTNRELSSYIQVVTFQQATVSDGVLAVANQYFGTQYQHTKLLGTSHKASCFVNDGVVFGLQGKRGEVFRYQGDGEATISNVKMINYFNQLSADGVTDAVAIYDRYREQYILTVWRKYSAEVMVNNIIGTGNSYAITLRGAANIPIPLANELGTVQLQTVSNGKWKSYTGLVTGVAQTGVTDIAMTVTTTDILNPNLLSADAVFIYSLPETIAWHNGDTTINKDRWVTKYSFTPECYAQTGSDIVSFKNGEIWWHNKNALRNNFYDVQYTSMVQPVFNTEPDIMKVWNACTLFQLQDDNGNDWAATSIINNNGQASRLVKGSWVKKAENWYASFRRDLNDTTKPLNLRITQGRNLRSSTLTCTLENDYTGEVRLFEWQANWTPSMRTGK